MAARNAVKAFSTGERPRIAIVSDPLVQRGGAERVVEALAEAFPEAPIFAVLYDAKTGPATLASRVTGSWLDRIPGASRRHRAFLPFYRQAVESFDLTDFDVIVSSHHTVAKGVLTRSDQVHVCYCHTPMRALWERPAAELATLPAPARPLAAAPVLASSHLGCRHRIARPALSREQLDDAASHRDALSSRERDRAPADRDRVLHARRRRRRLLSRRIATRAVQTCRHRDRRGRRRSDASSRSWEAVARYARVRPASSSSDTSPTTNCAR